MLTAYFAMARSADRGATAGSSRSSSAMPSSACSASRRPTRTTPSARSARRCGSRTRPSACRASAARRSGCGSASTRARRSSGSASTPGSGERFLAGDAINTASRIQSVAPEMGVAVGRGDLRGDEGDLRLRGARRRRPSRARPSRCGSSIARAPRARLGVDLTRTHDGPYVGRDDRPRASSRALFDKTVATGSVQLVTVVGEPGIGKSRIVAELLAHAQATRRARDVAPGPLPAVRRRGHVLGAGRDRQGAGRDPRVGRPGRRRRQARRRRCPTAPNATWLRAAAAAAARGRVPSARRARGAVRRLARRSSSGSPRIARPSSCSRTSTGPTTRCSPSSSTSPTGARASRCSSSATARPELFERHADFAAGLPNVNRINLAPLTDDETERLVAGSSGRVVPASSRRRSSSAPRATRCTPRSSSGCCATATCSSRPTERCQLRPGAASRCRTPSRR